MMKTIAENQRSKKVKKILRILLTFPDLCAIITIEGQRKSKTNTD